MKTININFTDFWPGFDKYNNYFYNLLKDEFNVIISENPDYLLFSVFGQNNLSYNCKKIFYTGENIAPNFSNCDYAFSFDKLDDNRNYRLPHYLLYDGYYDITNKEFDNSVLDRKFCNFLVSNPGCSERNEFFDRLSKYKKVDSGGNFKNNIGYVVSNGLEFQSNYKFTIAFENNAYRPGYEWYITEKIFNPMRVNSIPIYKGGSMVYEDFNTKSFVNSHDFKSTDELIDYIIYLDENENEYIKMMNESWVTNNVIPDNNKIENIKKFLYKIFN